MGSVVSLELNELNFDLVRRYCEQGRLPAFQRLFREYEVFETVSEPAYPYLEPWIQWPTVYSGRSYDEHRVFRLGDIVEADHPQIWEVLEQRGVSVGAVSPMNAANRCSHADFFIPDPWTQTAVTGDAGLRNLYELVRDTVNANAHEERSAAKLGMALLPHLARYARPGLLPEYARILKLSVRHKWARAAFLDRLLTDTFMKLRAQHRTGFASLFLNAAAHIQHHYLFDAAVYTGEARNPEWYSQNRRRGLDPLLFIYRTYDRVIADMLKLSDVRLFITTGLSQVPNPKIIYQYRFKEHTRSLERFGIGDGTVVPRMSRDFLIEFATLDAAAQAEARMSHAICADKALFTIENRGTSLFCQIGYFGEQQGLTEVKFEGATFDLSDEVALVSIENGIHQTIGYHVDTAVRAGDGGGRIPLASLFDKFVAAASGEGEPKVAAAHRIAA